MEQQEAIFDQFDTDHELTFEAFWEMIISPNNEHPEFQAHLQFALVEQDIRECAAYALKEMFLWVHRMDYYRGSRIGRTFVLGSDQVEPRRSTLASLKTLRVLDCHKASDSAIFTEDQPLYAVAVWLDNVAAKDEYQYVMGLLSLLSGLRKYLDGEDDLAVPGRAADEALAAKERSRLEEQGLAVPGAKPGRRRSSAVEPGSEHEWLEAPKPQQAVQSAFSAKTSQLFRGSRGKSEHDVVSADRRRDSGDFGLEMSDMSFRPSHLASVSEDDGCLDLPGSVQIDLPDAAQFDPDTDSQDEKQCEQQDEHVDEKQGEQQGEHVGGEQGGHQNEEQVEENGQSMSEVMAGLGLGRASVSVTNDLLSATDAVTAQNREASAAASEPEQGGHQHEEQAEENGQSMSEVMAGLGLGRASVSLTNDLLSATDAVTAQNREASAAASEPEQEPFPPPSDLAAATDSGEVEVEGVDLLEAPKTSTARRSNRWSLLKTTSQHTLKSAKFGKIIKQVSDAQGSASTVVRRDTAGDLDNDDEEDEMTLTERVNQ
jgi:hypothetical protein